MGKSAVSEKVDTDTFAEEEFDNTKMPAETRRLLEPFVKTYRLKFIGDQIKQVIDCTQIRPELLREIPALRNVVNPFPFDE